MRNYIKYLSFLIVLSGSFLVHAGAYDDFFRAIRVDDARGLRSLLQRGFDPNTHNPKGLGGLYLAMREPSPQAARVLIEWPATDLEARTPQDESALMIAALSGQLEIARLLIDKGAHVNKTGWTPLHYAATNGHLDMIRLLLDHYAYIDAESPNGTTPLMMAAHYGSADAVKLLLEEGADPLLKNQLGMNAIDFANQLDRKDAADLIAARVRLSLPKGKW